MLSQPDFDKACEILKECLQAIGWQEVSTSELDGGFIKRLYLWSPWVRPRRSGDHRYDYVNRKSLDVNPVDRHEVIEWLRRGFPMLSCG